MSLGVKVKESKDTCLQHDSSVLLVFLRSPLQIVQSERNAF
jgi:hypothetical protein